MTKILIGTSGWSYPHWKSFYEGVKIKDHLAFFSRQFPTVEINNTFYRTPSEKAVQNWATVVPEGFLFSIKANRFITHRKMLKEAEESVAYFFKSLQPLGSKLGPILFQLPPWFHQNTERLETFLPLIPQGVRAVFDFRHESWFNDATYTILHKHKAALVITDLADHPSPVETTTDFTYLRLHGPHKAYSGSYGPVGLKKWKDLILKFKEQNLDVYCYFDNDEKGAALKDARDLTTLMGEVN